MLFRNKFFYRGAQECGNFLHTRSSLQEITKRAVITKIEMPVAYDRAINSERALIFKKDLSDQTKAQVKHGRT